MPPYQYQLFLVSLLITYSQSIITVEKLAKENCPPGCRCNAERVDCVNEGPTRPQDDALFSQITASNFPELDTLIIKGYNFTDMDVKMNLFGSNEHHRYLSFLDLSNNSLVELHQNLLQGVPMLEQLILNDNQLVQIGKDVFWKTPKLRSLNLSRAFDSHASSQDRASMLLNLFVTNYQITFKHQNNFTEMTRIDLSENKLEFLEPSTFCQMLGEPTITLADNLLTAINLSECPRGLRGLNISGNLLSTIPSSELAVWDTWEQLLSVDLSNNPWSCDCHAVDLIEWVFKNRDLLKNKDSTICMYSNPSSLTAHSLSEVDQSVLSCDAETMRSHLLSVCFLMLSLVALSVVFVWFMMRNKEAIAKKFQNSTSKQFVMNKYSKLVDAENNPAEFV